MTVAALVSTVDYAENGITRVFAAPFRFLPGTITVLRILADTTIVPLAAGTDYTVSGGETDAGGTVTIGASIAGATLRIGRATPLQQRANYTTGDRFPAALTENAFDRAMLIAQEERDARIALDAVTVQVPPGERGFALQPVAVRHDRLTMFDGAGRLVAFAEAGVIVATDIHGKPYGVSILDILAQAGVGIHDEGVWRPGLSTVDEGGWAPDGTIHDEGIHA